MGRNASAFSLIILLMLSSMLPVAFAQEDFTASSQASYTLCPCSGQGYPLTITNTGTTASTYTLSSSGAAKEWITFNPSSFALNAKQSRTIAVYVNSPCDQRQPVPISAIITTKSGISKAVTTSIQFSSSCYGFSLTQGTLLDSSAANTIDFTPYEGSYSLCAFDTKAIPILVNNLDTALDNTYSFSVDGPARLPVSSFGLKKGGAAVLMIEVSPQTAGLSEFTLSAAAEKGQLAAKKKISLDVKDCYSIAADITSEKIRLCAGDTERMEVLVTNKGTFRENISLSLEGPAWASTDVDSLSLGSRKFSSKSIYLSPPAGTKGEFPVVFKAELPRQSISAQDSILVDVEASSSCYSSGIGANGKIIAGEDYLPVVIRNTGSRQQTFSVWIENIDWGALSENRVTINANDERHLTLHLLPNKNTPSGKYAVVIGIASPNQMATKEIAITYAPDTPRVIAIKDFSFTYRYYLYAGVALLIVLFLLRNPLLKAYRKRKRMAELRAARKEAAKKAHAEREAKMAKQPLQKRFEGAEPLPWTSRQWASAAIIILAVLLGACLALFPAGAKAFILQYKSIIGIPFLLAIVLIFILKRIIKKRRKRKKR